MMELILPYIAVGVGAGFLSGLMGVGGGLVVVPALFAIFKQVGFEENILMRLAAGTSLAAMIVTALFSMWMHIRHGAVVGPVFKKMALGIVLGTVFGVIAAGYIKSNVLSGLFGVFLIAMAFKMFFSPKIEAHETLPPPGLLNLASFGVALLAGMFGIGGGALLIPLLTYYNVSIKNMIGISLACGALVSIIGTIVFLWEGLSRPDLPGLSTGYIYWPAVFGIALGSPLFSYFGAKLAIRLPVKKMQIIFGIFLLAVAYKMINSSL